MRNLLMWTALLIANVFCLRYNVKPDSYKSPHWRGLMITFSCLGVFIPALGLLMIALGIADP